MGPTLFWTTSLFKNRGRWTENRKNTNVYKPTYSIVRRTDRLILWCPFIQKLDWLRFLQHWHSKHAENLSALCFLTNKNPAAVYHNSNCLCFNCWLVVHCNLRGMLWLGRAFLHVLIFSSVNCGWSNTCLLLTWQINVLIITLGKKATIQQVTTMLATSKMSYFQVTTTC